MLALEQVVFVQLQGPTTYGGGTPGPKRALRAGMPKTTLRAWVMLRVIPAVCNTITEATTSPGIEGRPRSEGNTSAKNSLGNNRCRCSAKRANTLPEPPWTYRRAG